MHERGAPSHFNGRKHAAKYYSLERAQQEYKAGLFSCGATNAAVAMVRRSDETCEILAKCPASIPAWRQAIQGDLLTYLTDGDAAAKQRAIKAVQNFQTRERLALLELGLL